MKKILIIVFISIVTIWIGSCEKEGQLTIHTYTLQYMDYSYPFPYLVEKADISIDEVDGKVYDRYESVYYQSFERVYKDVYLNTYEDYMELSQNTDEVEPLYSEAFFSENSLIIIPVLSSKMPFYELSNYELIAQNLNLSFNMKPRKIRYEGSQYFVFDNYYQIVVEINRKNILTYDYQIVETIDQNFMAYAGDEAYLENDFQFITDYNTFYDLFKESSSPLSSSSVLDFVDDVTFEDNYVFAYQRTNVGYRLVELSDYYFDYDILGDKDFNFVVVFEEDYKDSSGVKSAIAPEDTTLYILILPNTLYTENIGMLTVFGTFNNEVIFYNMDAD